MNVLIACEESQEVCKAFRARGHRAFSCDIQECSGGHPEWHIQGDVLPLINGGCTFTTMDGKERKQLGEWDILIAHPPCTYLTVSGNRWFNVEKYGNKAIEREREREKGFQFFMQFANAKCERIAIENPIGVVSTWFRKPDQIIQPYEYGHPAKKSTCLWLKNLPKLEPTNIVEPELVQYKCKNGKTATFSADYGGGNAGRGKRRSKTYRGIAEAMADQWASPYKMQATLEL